jgi:hypothetical protein
VSCRTIPPSTRDSLLSQDNSTAYATPTALLEHWTTAARRQGLATQPRASFEQSREPFAAAERLAHWFAATISNDAAAILEALTEWRDKYRAPLSDGALAMVTAHVAQSTRE